MSPKYSPPIAQFAEIINNSDVLCKMVMYMISECVAVRIMQQDIIIVQALYDWPNGITLTARVSLNVG